MLKFLAVAVIVCVTGLSAVQGPAIAASPPNQVPELVVEELIIVRDGQEIVVIQDGRIAEGLEVEAAMFLSPPASPEEPQWMLPTQDYSLYVPIIATGR